VEKTGTSWVLRVSPEEVMRDVDYALKELGTDYLDIIVLCRVPKDRPIEEVVHSMKAVVDAGTVRNRRASAELSR
jgi:aryl-alcohol dehydrogenase-like predicted oxidoreductase